MAGLRQGGWVVYYDGACGFCRRWVRRAQRLAMRQVQWRDFHLHGGEVAHLQPDFARSAYLVIDNRVALPGFRGFRRLLLAMPLLWPLLAVAWLPGMRWLGEAAYRFLSVRYGPGKPERTA